MSDAARRLFRELVERLRKLFDDLDVSLEYHYRDTHRKTVDAADELEDVDKFDLDDEFELPDEDPRTEIRHWRHNKLASRVAAIVDLSPTFRKDLERLRNEGWAIEYGAMLDSGAKKKLTIMTAPTYVSPQTATTAAVRSLVEQVGLVSGRSIGKTIAPPSAQDTWESWGPDQVRKLLDRRGYMYLKSAEVRREILDKHGLDINEDLPDEDWLMAQRANDLIANESMTRDQAVRQLGDMVGETSLDFDTTYADYYRDVALEYWDGFCSGERSAPWPDRYY